MNAVFDDDVVDKLSCLYLRNLLISWSATGDFFLLIRSNFFLFISKQITWFFLDNKTAKASGESTDYYEGFKKASLQVLDLLEILIAEEPEQKIIKITSKESTRVRDQKLAKEIWGWKKS